MNRPVCMCGEELGEDAVNGMCYACYKAAKQSPWRTTSYGCICPVCGMAHLPFCGSDVSLSSGVNLTIVSNLGNSVPSWRTYD